MANPEHVRIVKQGADAIRKWRQQHPRARFDLSGADLRGTDLTGAGLSEADLLVADRRWAAWAVADLDVADQRRADLSWVHLQGAGLRRAYLRVAGLSGADLSWADLRGAYLTGADLTGANLRVTNLRWADLSGAYLSWADLGVANLAGADLDGADLSWADLHGANLAGADLKEAICGFTAFADVDLSETKGLETVEHRGPSTVGIDTIFKSKGRIPEVFLRGCGVPEEWIGYIQDMAKKPIEFYTCFISHSAQDQLLCDRLHNDLKAKGVRCWYFPADARGGRGLKEEIFDRGVRLYDKVMVVCSAHSLASEPVRKEIKAGWDKERATGKLVLFPVAIDDSVYKGDDLYARLLRESRVIEDFRRWTIPAEYAKSLEKLVKDLARDEPAPPSPTSA